MARTIALSTALVLIVVLLMGLALPALANLDSSYPLPCHCCGYLGNLCCTLCSVWLWWEYTDDWWW